MMFHMVQLDVQYCSGGTAVVEIEWDVFGSMLSFISRIL